MKINVNQLERGDVLLNKKHHTAIYSGDGQIVHASINEKGTTTGGKTGDQTGREICRRSFYVPSFGWDCVLRHNDPEIADKAATFAEQIADDDKHGYDQISRWGDDFDCSSLVIESYETAGAPVKTKGATYTGNMYGIFKKCGFSEVTFTEETAPNASELAQNAPTEKDGKLYTVKKGDTLAAISKTWGCSVDDILKANPVFIKNPDKIYIGDKLTKPTGKTAAAEKIYTGKIKTVYGSPLRVRKGPGTNHEVLALIPNGSTVKILTPSGDWLKLADRDGYIAAQYVAIG